jgi:signal transduction histidine kinase
MNIRPKPFKIIALEILIIFCLFTGALIGEEYALDDSRKEFEITSNLVYAIVKEEKSTFSQLKTLQFDKVPQNKNNFGFEDKIYIFHTTLVNTSSIEKWILYLSFPTLDYVDLYVDFKNGKEPNYFESGDMLPFKNRFLPDRRINFEINFKDNPSLDLYIRMKSSGAKQFTTFLISPDEFGNLRGMESMGLGFYYGGLFLIAFYNLFIFIFLRDKTYFIYFLFLITYLLLQSGVNGTVLQYLFPNFPRFTNILLLESYVAVLFTGMLFCEYYLKLEGKTKKISQLFQLVVILLLINVFILPPGYIIKGIAVLGLLMPGFWMYSAIRSIVKKQEGSIYYLIAWSILIAGIVIYSLKSFGVLPANFFTEYAVQIGSLLEALLLSVGLAYRIDILKRRSDYLNENLQNEVNLRTDELKSEKDKVELAYSKAEVAIANFKTSQDNLLLEKKDTENLNLFVKSLNESLDLPTIMDKLITYLNDRYGLCYYVLGLVQDKNDFGQTVMVKMPSFFSEEEIQNVLNMKVQLKGNLSAHAYAFSSKKPLYFSKVKPRGVTQEELYVLQKAKIESFIIIPLNFQGKPIGTLDLWKDGRMNLNKEDITRLSILGEHLAGIINSSILFKEIQLEKENSENARIELYTNTERLKKISEFTTTIQSSTNFLSVLHKLKSYFSETYELKNLAIYLVNKEKQELTYNILFGEEISQPIQEEISKRNLPFSETKGLHMNCYLRNKTIFLSNMKDRKIDSPSETANQELLKMKALYIAPLVFENEIFGVISLTSLSKPIYLSSENRKFLDQLIFLISSSMYTFLQIEKVEISRQKQEEAYKELKASQEQLIQSEKMAALGNLVSGVAHEINTPIGAIKASSSNIQLSLDEFLKEGINILRDFDNSTIEYIQKFIDKEIDPSKIISTREERKIRKELKTKLELLEVPNPDEISEVLIQLKIDTINEEYLPLWRKENNIKIAKIIYELAGLKLKSKNIDNAVEKTSKIIYALKSYAKTDAPNIKVEANLVEGLETVLTIYQNYIKQGITVVREYSEIPMVNCYEAELNQVWTNIIFNAIQAMKNKGTLTINVREENENSQKSIVVSIRDNGSGIPKDIQPKIFDAFYTTKKSGEGSGLGLHICKQIIDKHNGSITVDSEIGNTTFKVKIPLENSNA